MNFSYGDCKSNGVGYFDGSNLFCYWIDENLGPSHDACNGDFSVIESLDAQRVVNWLIKIEYAAFIVTNRLHNSIETTKPLAQ